MSRRNDSGSPAAIHVGVDGCRGGWFAVTEVHGDLEFGVFANMRRLLDAYPRAELILVDIPIGLPWSACRSRPCDTEARAALRPPRASSVFPAPCRAAARAVDYPAAKAANIVELGRGLSKQAFAICPKIAEVDRLLGEDLRARQVLHEMHPEVCFWALNGRKAMDEHKAKDAGHAQRLALLAEREPRTHALVVDARRSTGKKEVQDDDVLDALAGLVTARAGLEMLRASQANPRCDEAGLPMEMLYIP